MTKNVCGSSGEGPASYSCQILMKQEVSRQIFEKYSDIKIHGNLSSGSRVVPWGRKDGQMDRRTYIHDEAKSSFSQFYVRA
jgi:hypothetical protein